MKSILKCILHLYLLSIFFKNNVLWSLSYWCPNDLISTRSVELYKLKQFGSSFWTQDEPRDPASYKYLELVLCVKCTTRFLWSFGGLLPRQWCAQTFCYVRLAEQIMHVIKNQVDLALLTTFSNAYLSLKDERRV